MMYFQAIIFGLIQGLTEFLPISSSAHLVLLPWFTGWTDPGLAFNVALHWGTLLGVVIYFRQDLIHLTKGWIGSFSGKRETENKLPWFVIIGTIPAAALGFVFEEQAETIFRSPWVIAGSLSFFALVLLGSDRRWKERHSLSHLNWFSAFLIGASQGIAIIPGVSRSGISISIALLFALKRSAAVQFSFLLSIPLIFGAGILKSAYLIQNIGNPIFLTGILASAVSGYAAISFLMHHVKTRSFTFFVIYRLVLAGVIAGILLRG